MASLTALWLNTRGQSIELILYRVGAIGPAKIQEVTLMRPFHGNL